MKTRLYKPTGNTAGSLVVTLVICSLLSLSIFGYLSLVEQQSKLSARSQAWNAAMAIVEAGIEEGLQHLNTDYSNLASQGWSANGTLFSVSNVLANGSAYYTVINYAVPSKPEITCQAYVSPSSYSSLATIGVNATPKTVSRKVRVRCSKGSLFIKALAAKKEIDMNGNNILTDSFDSTDPLYNSGGLYDPNKVKDNGDVASNDSIKNTIDVGNANIYGRVSTGPGGTVAIGSNGGVGSHVWQATNDGIQPGWVTHDSNFTFPDTTLPYNSGLTPASGNVTETVLVITTNSVTTSEPPASNPWGGVGTNIVSTTTLANYPSPPPPGLYTNTVWVEVSIAPEPPPAGLQTVTTTTTTSSYPTSNPSSITTNTLSESFLTWSRDYPQNGTYVPPVITKVVDSGPSSGRGTWYGYYRITGYTYTYDVTTYKYPTHTYSYPTYSYTYNNYNTNTIYQTNYYDQILQSGKYYMSGALSGKTIVLGKAELVCAGGINFSGNDVLKIATGASLTNWVGGTSVKIAGNGVVNKTGNAANYVCLCAPTVTSLSLGGNGEFTGVMVAPEAVTQLNGGGSGDMDFIGCLMMKSIKMNGHFKFHYDEALGKLAGNGRFLITSWDEIPVN